MILIDKARECIKSIKFAVFIVKFHKGFLISSKLKILTCYWWSSNRNIVLFYIYNIYIDKLVRFNLRISGTRFRAPAKDA